MDKQSLIIEEYKKKFNRCINEYINAGGMNIEEDEQEGQMPEQPADNEMPQQDMPQGDMPQDSDPNMMQGDMAGDPNAAQEQTPPGFDPQVPADANMGQAPVEEPQEEEEVIDVDELTDAQEKTEDKLDSLTRKFEKVMDMVGSFEKKIDASNDKITRMEADIKAEIEKRNPTPIEKMSMRTTKSYPYSSTPNEYWANEAPENYSPEEDQKVYTITKGDIDGTTDWQGIAKSMNDPKYNDLHNILGY